MNFARLNKINLQALKVGAAHSPSLFLLEVNTRRICLFSIITTRNDDAQMIYLISLPRNMKSGNVVRNLLCYEKGYFWSFSPTCVLHYKERFINPTTVNTF